MKTFDAYWSDSFYNPGTETVDETFFCEERCYAPEEIAAIAGLAVGQTWMSDMYGSHHTVKRIT